MNEATFSGAVFRPRSRISVSVRSSSWISIWITRKDIGGFCSSTCCRSRELTLQTLTSVSASAVYA